jgi:hypothetical protein
MGGGSCWCADVPPAELAVAMPYKGTFAISLNTTKRVQDKRQAANRIRMLRVIARDCKCANSQMNAG